MKLFGVDINQRPLIIAEIGINHNGDMTLAKELISAAKENGADAVKFQNFTMEEFYVEKWAREKKGWNSFLWEDLKKLELKEEQLAELKEYAEKTGIHFFSTPFSERDADILEKIGVEVYKVASMDINNTPFLQYLAGKGKPIIVSTGMSTLWEIDMGIQTLIDESATFAILYCVSLYPPTPEKVHLRSLKTLMSLYPDIPVGYSDHTLGIHAPIAAMAMGAKIIEKHFTLDKNLPGPDHRVSMTPDELKLLSQAAKELWTMLGKSWKQLSQEEKEIGKIAKRSIVLRKAKRKGETIRREDITFKRPGTGIPPYEVDKIVGRKVKHDLPPDHILKWSDLL